MEYIRSLQDCQQALEEPVLDVYKDLLNHILPTGSDFLPVSVLCVLPSTLVLNVYSSIWQPLQAEDPAQVRGRQTLRPI